MATLANQGIPCIWVGYAEGHPTSTYWALNPKTKKIILTWDMTFLQKSYSEYTKDEKPVLVTISYEGLDNEEEFEMVSIVTNNNNVNVVSDSKSHNDNKNKENFFDQDINDEVKATPKPLLMQNWFMQEEVESFI